MKALVLLCVNLAAAEEWAILAAGSSGFWNYRHQADVCHAYQVLLSHDFDPTHIILFSYDDVPSDPLNPMPNTLYNRPGDAPNVNQGCAKDYTGAAVSANNFLAVLTGNSTALVGGNGKVLKSGPNDTVFIYYVDHGAPGLVAFPSSYLYADQLVAALNYMWTKGMYDKLVMYVEACESGSLFSGLLPNNTRVFATTSANSQEPSWGTYCPPDDVVHDTAISTCLGDMYSVSWMENSDNANFTVETLWEQFEEVQLRTNQSHVSQYGDVSFVSNTLSLFQGSQSTASAFVSSSDSVYWNSRLAKLEFLTRISEIDPTADNLRALHAEISFHQLIELRFQLLVEMLDPSEELDLLNSQRPVDDFYCLRAAVESYETQCGTLGEFGLAYVQVLVNACHYFDAQVLNEIFTQICAKYS